MDILEKMERKHAEWLDELTTIAARVCLSEAATEVEEFSEQNQTDTAGRDHLSTKLT